MHHYTLTPLIAAHWKEFLHQGHREIAQVLLSHGSPLNLLFPEQLLTNTASFEEVFRKHHIRGFIYYAHKANKSIALAKTWALSNMGIDVASEQELGQALAAGFSGTRIEATGPKNDLFLLLCIQHGVTINCNSLDELLRIIEIKKHIQDTSQTPLFIRIQNFPSPQLLTKDSKFGVPQEQFPHILTLLQEHHSLLRLRGVSFHLSTTSEKERSNALIQSIELTEQARQRGFRLDSINVGGGFSVNHLENPQEWETYISALQQSVVTAHFPSMSWNNTGLGYWSEQGTLRGGPAFSEFYRPYTQYEELDRVLSTPHPDFGTIGQYFSENLVELIIEPGRGLLDQVGSTLATVLEVQVSQHGEQIVFLEMNRNHMNASELEFMSDPILISQEHTQGPSGVFLSGNLCLPHDFITKRKIFLPQLPRKGDILVFMNTAAYFMDFGESTTLQHPLADKIVLTPSHKVVKESLYHPFVHNI